MAKTNSRMTSEDLIKMNQKEWDDFREKTWLKRRETYNQDLPEWFMRDKESTIKKAVKFESKASKK